ncbi:unnamed protein product [Rangifer tarandus platyrhynchus]|uniref:Uncharacterized protein n=2 Tax=Rangifer tarandus platyrhynchus TaxID=3082113 RepID=A0ABN8YSY9_RANTA|nr:unnamed protein product [Rangifer tarandus platyrhynchus]
MSPRKSAPPAGVLNLWITASSKNLIKVLDRQFPITPVCAHAWAHVPFCILFGSSQIPSNLSVAPGPQLDVSGLPPSGNRWGWGGCKCPLSALERSPLPPSNSGSSQPSLSWTPGHPHTRRDMQTLRAPPPLASSQPSGSQGGQGEGSAGAPPGHTHS